MKKMIIFIVLISLTFYEVYSLYGYEVESGVYNEDLLEIEEMETTNINEPANQHEKEIIFQDISFQAKKNPYVRISFQDQQIEGLLMGMKADSVLIETFITSKQKIKVQIAGRPDIVTPDQYSTISEIKYIPIKEIHHIRVIRKSKLGEYLAYGLLIGAGTGFIIGLAGGDTTDGWVTFTAEEKALCGAQILGAIGGIIGGLSGLGTGIDSIYDLVDHSYFQKVQVIRKLSGYGN